MDHNAVQIPQAISSDRIRDPIQNLQGPRHPVTAPAALYAPDRSRQW
jgi:hypothetical protein